MNRPLATLGVVLLLLTVLTAGVPVASGDAFGDPLIYDWLNNQTEDEASHVSDYGIDTPEQYFSGGLSGPQDIENKLNESVEQGTASEDIYRVYDEVYLDYQTEPVYEMWNRNNVDEYDRRQLIPEFKHKEVENESGDEIYNLDPDDGEFMIQKGWTGMYSVQPSAYAHYFPPEDDEYLGTSKHVVGDTVTVFAVVGGERGMTPPDRRDGSLSSIGTLRYQYSFDSLTRRAVLVLDAESGQCSGGCVVSETEVSGNVAEFEDVEISNYVSPGTEFDLITRGIVQIAFSEDVDERVERTREVTCPEPDDPNETVDPPCFEDYMTWDDDEENTVTETMQTSDRQSFLYPEDFNSGNIEDEVEYERAIYPNGTVEIHIDMGDAEGSLTDNPIWRKIEVGDEYVASPWRTWSSRNMSWDYMYESQGSEQELESHTRPLAFHTAPLRVGMSSSSGMEFKDYRYSFSSSSFNPYRYGLVQGGGNSYYDSPYLIRHKSCQAFWPQQDEETMYCGWWLTGSGNTVDELQNPPFLEMNNTGIWTVEDELYMTIDAGSESLQQREMQVYGLAPNQTHTFETDRYVVVKETKMYSEIVDDNFNEGADRTWVEVRLTLTDAETDGRIQTEGRSGEYIRVENVEFDEDGEHDSDRLQTNESGQVTVRIYDVKDEGIQAEYTAQKWYDVPDGEAVYTGSSIDREVIVPAFSMYDLIRYLVIIFWIIYITVFAMVRFMQVLGVQTTVRKELRGIFPGQTWKVILWSLVLFFILSLDAFL